ncbi:hypothetical protein GGTG_08225 [Gaeumannomyces tritici R3-111a-1]|uniref:DUF7702 domain-containing protein n=1 Tax=Gaeumannomyces tritici (strain R3-111a-1) TaxID=644352 RepID=J3P3Z0_GAET3|nr:hypothetical protein GGTG_08225 [Gaeumannomyces tritici R3-111a-1]EJT74384.1 hypothetical protein GGTG_08225 [Gaeumannomyces tritici R3-111a-1]
MAQLTTHNRISIAEICVYTPSLAVAIVLAIRHGFKRSSGWLYLILFSVIRLLAASLQLATINNPDNIGLIVGAMSLQAAGLSPLILVSVGLLGRVSANITKSTSKAGLPHRVFRLLQVVVMIGLILSIIGGNKLGDKIGDLEAQPGGTSDGLGSLQIPTESQAGIGLMLAGFGILVGATIALSLQARSIETGERRVLGAVAFALPFIAVRIVYSAVATYSSSNRNFRWFDAGPSYYNYLIGMDVCMEMLAVLVFLTAGLLIKQLRTAAPDNASPTESQTSSYRHNGK